MISIRNIPSAVAFAAALTTTCWAGVPADEAAKLKSTLTPLGAERAGNAAGSIPAWTGVYETPQQGWGPGKRRNDPFAADKPLFTVTPKNAGDHAAQLSEGVKALLKQYPETYRLDVYPSRRTGGAPQWVYDNTYNNALNARLVEDADGKTQLTGAHGGVPFPIPKSGLEVMRNGVLTWKGQSKRTELQGWTISRDGNPVLTSQSKTTTSYPFYDRKATPETHEKGYLKIRMETVAPVLRAGDAIVGINGLDPEDDRAWTYMQGQRRVRRLPVACCDTPTPATAGLASFDELNVFSGRTDLFDWKLVGKREMLIPYNSNRLLVPPKSLEVIGPKHLKPEFVRWELHRVWVVEATLKPGKRHVAPKGRYYIDEDTWLPVLGERYDARGQLWKVLWQVMYAMPDLPGVYSPTFGFNDLLADTWFVSGILNETTLQALEVAAPPESFYNPNTLAGEGVR